MGGNVAAEVKERSAKYRELTEKALGKVAAMEERGNELLEMARNYLEDGKHFEEQGNYVLALAAFSYAHAWIDAGVRLKFLDGKGDDRLFTLPR